MNEESSKLVEGYSKKATELILQSDLVRLAELNWPDEYKTTQEPIKQEKCCSEVYEGTTKNGT